MPQRTLPGLGLTGFWDLGADGWNTENDANLRLLSALVQARVLSRATALPGSPTDGQIYIVPSEAGANANSIAIRDNAAWVYVVPQAGYRVWVADTSTFAYFNGSAWVSEVTDASALTILTKTASHTLVLSDAAGYIRMNVAGANTLTVPAEASVPFPIGTVVQVRQAGAGQTTFLASSGVSITSPESLSLRKQGSSASLVKVAADSWELIGDLEALP